MAKNLYEILGVSKTANDAEIKKAYHKLVMQYHPDRNPDNKEAESKFKEINSAYDILRDPQKRAAYDQFSDAAFQNGNTGGGAGFNGFGGGFGGFGAGGADFSDIFEDLFGGMGFGGGTKQQRNQPGRDLLHEVTMSLHDAFLGKTETVTFTAASKCKKCHGHGTDSGKEAPTCSTCHGSGMVRRSQGFFAMQTPCPECHGSGHIIKSPCTECHGNGVVNEKRTLDVKIPAGVMDGTRLRLAGMGEASVHGGRAGDFYVDIRVRADKTFDRDGDDLHQTISVPFTTLAMGGKIDVDTIDGKPVELKIADGTQIGTKMRVRGRGMPVVGRDSRGDMYVHITTDIPKKLTDKQRELLEKFAAEKPKKGWF